MTKMKKRSEIEKKDIFGQKIRDISRTTVSI